MVSRGCLLLDSSPSHSGRLHCIIGMRKFDQEHCLLVVYIMGWLPVSLIKRSSFYFCAHPRRSRAEQRMGNRFCITAPTKNCWMRMGKSSRFACRWWLQLVALYDLTFPSLRFPSCHRCPLTSRWFGFARAPIWVPLSSMLASAASTAYCGSD